MTTTKKTKTKKSTSKTAQSTQKKEEWTWDQIGKVIGTKIEKGSTEDNPFKQQKKEIHKEVSGGAVYCLGLIGAAIYYLSTTTGFWMGVLGVLKAIIWPVFLIYHALSALGA